MRWLIRRLSGRLRCGYVEELALLEGLLRRLHADCRFPIRYYGSDEEEEGLFESDSGPFKTDLVMPKSKGADFGFLISEALSQSPTNFPESFGSFFPDGRVSHLGRVSNGMSTSLLYN